MVPRTHRSRPWGRLTAATVLSIAVGAATPAQVTPASGSTTADDTPSITAGTVIFADYTYQKEPDKTDPLGKTYAPRSFNITRAYIYLTGRISHLMAFRVTGDVKQETKTTSSASDLAESYVYKLKHAYGQLNLDDWMTQGSWVRFGIHQTPYIDAFDNVYRYRFQGPGIVDREKLVSSADAGVSMRYAFPKGFGDVHFGAYNGEGYDKLANNNLPSYQIRVGVRPMPAMAVAKGLQFNVYYIDDRYAVEAMKRRLVGNALFEQTHVVAGVEYAQSKDETLTTTVPITINPRADGEYWSVWATPRIWKGLEMLLRYDEIKPSKNLDDRQKTRKIAGIAYWFPAKKEVQTAVLLDYEGVDYTNYTATPDEKRYALHFGLKY